MKNFVDYAKQRERELTKALQNEDDLITYETMREYYNDWVMFIIPDVSGSTHGECKHLNEKEISRNYPDAYVEYECLDCGERIIEDMYNS